MTTNRASGRIEILKAGDGHAFEAWISRPVGQPRGAVLLLQEIFGLNGHVRHKADEYAAQGFLAVAPGLFDRAERGLVLGYGEIQRGMACVGAITEAMLLADVQASIDAASAELVAAGVTGDKVSAIGWCWGGAVAFLAASKCHGLRRAACYYGTRIATFCERMTPAVPTIYHFGSLDKSLPPESIEKIRAHDAAGTFHVYEGVDHAFTNFERPAYAANESAIADRRTLDFIS